MPKLRRKGAARQLKVPSKVSRRRTWRQCAVRSCGLCLVLQAAALYLSYLNRSTLAADAGRVDLIIADEDEGGGLQGWVGPAGRGGGGGGGRVEAAGRDNNVTINTTRTCVDAADSGVLGQPCGPLVQLYCGSALLGATLGRRCPRTCGLCGAGAPPRPASPTSLPPPPPPPVAPRPARLTDRHTVLYLNTSMRIAGLLLSLLSKLGLLVLVLVLV